MENTLTDGNLMMGGFGKDSGPQRTKGEKFGIWFFQNRYNVFGAASAVTLASIMSFVEFMPVQWDFSDEVYEEVAFVSNLQVKTTESAAKSAAEGKISPTDKLEKEDPRVSQAVNPFQVNATQPVDLTPSIKPAYTIQARQAGFEGVMYLDIVVADTGEVLKVSPIFRTPVDKTNFTKYGLTRAAVVAFKRKKFEPAKKEGGPITVKIRVPIRFFIDA
jgi:protein TonB